MDSLKRAECAVLPLVLKRKWYDMIASGEKKQEYRLATPYWGKRIEKWISAKKVHVVEFRDGYGKDARRMAREIFMVGTAAAGCCRHPEWGEPNEAHYIIMLSAECRLTTERN